MPFCSQCGNQVAPSDIYCARCGTRQPIEPGAESVVHDPLSGVSARTASILCYIPAIGWICGVIVLASMKFRNNKVVRFHAFQGLYLFVAGLVAKFVLQPVFWMLPDELHIYRIVELILLIAAVFMMAKAAHDEAYSLPLFGELAERSVAEH
ncbi:MAG TPA: hypothetical protein VG456_11310 [Candidatus Sulfopaludibacter sp.]|jgi:uncharacterized membrane protein|nr:hypothetical protein [Candidatus Sulfopaludibacter sp.]